uniref:hypothetical protein n=1 Tax=Kitasatospora indigofera TaxID=67307 RepID=UPI002F90BAD3
MALVDIAVRQALLSHCRQRVGAVVTAGPRILALSPNLRRNDPAVDHRHATFHAEEAAVRRARRTVGAEVWVGRVNRAGRPVLARPCPRCQLTLARAGITRAHYTTDHAGVETLIIPVRTQGERYRCFV